MESFINTSGKVPGTGRVMMDREKMQELLDQLRLAVPENVKAAQEILQRRDSLYSEAQKEARHVKSEAEEEFRKRVNESEVVKVARRRAEEIQAEAQHKAQRILEQASVEAKSRKAESDAYASEVLRNLDKQLTTLLSTVRRGLEVLQ
jgi:cell division septum initiation protein DivIVA